METVEVKEEMQEENYEPLFEDEEEQFILTQD